MLRNIQALTKSAGASILAYPCNLFNLDGVLVTGTGPLFLQLFDKASAPVANDVPVECYEVTTTGPFPLASIWQAKWPIPFTLGLAVGISSVDFKYTAATATYSVSGQIEEGHQSTDAVVGLSIVGDTSTFVISQVAWNDGDANNSNALFRLRVSNNNAATRYIMLFGHPSSGGGYPANGDQPFMSWTLAGLASMTKYFGSGIRPYQVKQTTNISYYGCIIVCSTTPTILTATLSTDITCEMQYKALTQ